MDTTHSLFFLNSCSPEAFVEALGGIFEHSPWVAAEVAAQRPFSRVGPLHTAMCKVAQDAGVEQQVSLIRQHPDLGDRMTRLTQSSASEQKAAGLDTLTLEELEQFHACNQAYRERFGFPFVICARLNDKRSILQAFEARLPHTREEEIAIALEEIEKIARLRLLALVTE